MRGRHDQREELMLQLNAAYDDMERMRILEELVETFGDDVYRNEYKRLRKNHKDQEDAKKAATELSGAFLKAASRSKLFWYFIGIPIIAIIIWNLAQGLGIGALVLLLFVILILLGGLKFKQWYNNE